MIQEPQRSKLYIYCDTIRLKHVFGINEANTLSVTYGWSEDTSREYETGVMAMARIGNNCMHCVHGLCDWIDQPCQLS